MITLGVQEYNSAVGGHIKEGAETEGCTNQERKQEPVGKSWEERWGLGGWERVRMGSTLHIGVEVAGSLEKVAFDSKHLNFVDFRF